MLLNKIQQHIKVKGKALFTSLGTVPSKAIIPFQLTKMTLGN